MSYRHLKSLLSGNSNDIKYFAINALRYIFPPFPRYEILPLFNPSTECDMNINISNDTESKESSMCVVTVYIIIIYINRVMLFMSIH